MASLEGMLAVLKAGRRRAQTAAPALGEGRNILRGATGRAYHFEVLPVADVQDELAGVGAVYVYARNLSAGTDHAHGRDATVENYALGYVDQTEDLGAAAAAHEAAASFRGHDLDVVLFVRIEQAIIREEIAGDLVALHRPVLNDLLGGNQRA
mgnify:CR=1 FL=1